ncbi:macrolide transport system ATP-binding/permease protein [Gracilibacillus ureilyticus]|uniref:Macrolide transport system ATP-binding/permease protein n=1 Tax=Gracilibacillus ureilyticus TaxID=531814 RepID=A0A1H9NJM1_9BACI|nr:ABC-F type ribosomal protection protein [Gracilibacillus ureilyticus]SER35593.1 macrolide transport system ATP-binding/permease protein [Gracilibacillus ureilyticus]
MLLQVKQLVISVPSRTLVEVDSLEVHEGDRIGLVGKNGTGKTTFLHVIAGQMEPEQGDIISYTKMELLPQLKQQQGNKSGGEVTQQYIQQSFSNQTGLLLADEPTTHLDAKHIEWVEQIIKKWQGAFIVVSHDRAFLDAVCTKIWEVNSGTIREYQGNYQAYQNQKQQELHQQEQAYENYQTKKQQLERALALKEQKANRATKKPAQTSRSEAKITGAKPYFAKKQKKLQQTAKAIETRLEKIEKVEKPYTEKPLQMDLPKQEKIKDRNLIQIRQLSAKVGNKILWKDANALIKGGDKVAVIGENGSGKTTFIRKIIENGPEIAISSACQIAYFNQDLSLLHLNKSIIENVRETSTYDETLIRTVLARLHFFKEDVYKKIDILSGGERVKVALAKLFLSESNTLILDEPTNFLDVEAMEALEKLLTDYEGTLIFVSHDRRFVEKIATKVISIEKQQMHYFAGTYHQWKNRKTVKNDSLAEQKLLIETKITDTLSRLSMEPSDALEKEFQALLKEKQALEGR